MEGVDINGCGSFINIRGFGFEVAMRGGGSVGGNRGGGPSHPAPVPAISAEGGCWETQSEAESRREEITAMDRSPLAWGGGSTHLQATLPL